MTDLPENELLIRAKAGDEDAETELLRRYEPLARKHASFYARFGNTEEVLQAARTGIVEAARRFDPSRAVFSTWVYAWSSGLARTEARRYRSIVWHPVNTQVRGEDTQVDDLSLESDALDAEEMFGREELARSVAFLVNQCPDLDNADRYLLSNRLLMDGPPMTLQSIAGAVGLSREAVRLRELRLMRDVLPRVLAPLRDAVL